MSSAAAYEMGSVREEPFSWQLSAICPASCAMYCIALYRETFAVMVVLVLFSFVWLACGTCSSWVEHMYHKLGIFWHSWDSFVINSTFVEVRSGYRYMCICKCLQLFMQLFLHAVD